MTPPMLQSARVARPPVAVAAPAAEWSALWALLLRPRPEFFPPPEAGQKETAGGEPAVEAGR